ncbi:MAG: thiamine phosphate synthase [Rhodothalassiaceae bacterium]
MTPNLPEVKPLPAAIFIADRAIRPDMLAIARRLAPGTAILYRDYRASDRADMARRLKRLSDQRGLGLLIAGDARLAQAVGADGLHLPGFMLDRGAGAGRALRETFALLTAACHDRRQIAAARRLGVDALIVSPLFPTGSHPGQPALGPRRFRALAGGAGLPVYALGGIGRETVARVPHGVGIAAGSAFADPAFRQHQKLKRVPR